MGETNVTQISAENIWKHAKRSGLCRVVTQHYGGGGYNGP